MIEKLKETLAEVKEMRLATIAILLCFSLLGMVLWVGQDLGRQWIHQENERLQLNRNWLEMEEERIEAVRGLDETIRQAQIYQEKENVLSVKALEKLSEAIERYAAANK